MSNAIDESAVVVDKLELDRAMDRANQYLLRACCADGKFQYIVHLNSGPETTATYNILRHAGAIYALSDYAVYSNSDAGARIIRRAIDYMMDTAFSSVPGHTGLSAVWSIPNVNDTVDCPQAKLGGAALALIALIRSAPLVGDFDPDMARQLARFIRFMQKPDGEFYSKFYADGDGRCDNWKSQYYPGEAALGLTMMYSVDGDRGWLSAARRSLKFLAHWRNEQDQVPPDHWSLLATAQLMRQSDQDSAAEVRAHALDVAIQLVCDLEQGLPRQTLHNCALATRLEGLLAALDIVGPADHRLRARITKAINAGMRHLLDVQIDHGCYTGAIPRAVGSTGNDLARNAEVRIDYVQHALSAMISCHRHFDELSYSPASVFSVPHAELDRGQLGEALLLGTRFLMKQQKAGGNFVYACDWTTGRTETGDNAVRQAGAAWGLALLHRHNPNPGLRAACDRSAGFFLGNSTTIDDDLRYVHYPSDSEGKTGTVSLTALMLLEMLATEGPVENESLLREALRGYVRFIASAMMENGQWHSHYRHETGEPYGDPSPYYDGECLLALVRAARQFDEFCLVEPLIRRAAATGARAYIRLALRRDPDSPVTKAYFPWACMAFCDLAMSGWEETAQYADHVLELADWMIDVHGVLDRNRNTAYAFEGLIHAHLIARSRGDKRRETRYARVIHAGLARLMSWQVGHGVANDYIRSHVPGGRYAGGVQNHAAEGTLRIDVTQHQMHACILAMRHLV